MIFADTDAQIEDEDEYENEQLSGIDSFGINPNQKKTNINR
ncbi:MAG TPA: hypothetical protein VF020_24605 [Chthoniobacterales bacterium]